jgi:hypothetical protein
MSYDNFRWFLHVLLFMHARKVEDRIWAKTPSKDKDTDDLSEDENDVEAFGDF